MSAADVQYLKDHHVANIVDELIIELARYQPLQPMPFLAAHLDQMAQQGKYQQGRPRIVFVLGGPGSGKGTQCARLVEQYGCGHISAGDLLREEVKSGSEQGRMLDDLMKQGKIVPGHITISLLKKAIANIGGGGNNTTAQKWVLVDGFPREMAQAFDFERSVGRCEFVLSFDVPDDLLVQRLLKRGESSGRADDNLETIRKRLVTFHKQSQPVIEYFNALGKARIIQATGSVDDVWAEVMPLFAPIRQKIVFVLGGPGSGKGTQCAKLVERFGCGHLSAGDLLREEVKSGSAQGKMLDAMMKEGKIVPGHITISLVRKAIAKLPASAKWALVDGFPRAMDQALAFEAGVAKCDFVLSFDVSDDILVQRLTKRGETSGRADDNIETIKKRLVTFHTQSEPVLEYFRAQGKLRLISALGSVDEVWRQVEPLFQQ